MVRSFRPASLISFSNAPRSDAPNRPRWGGHGGRPYSYTFDGRNYCKGGPPWPPQRGSASSTKNTGSKLLPVLKKSLDGPQLRPSFSVYFARDYADCRQPNNQQHHRRWFWSL